MVRFGNLGGHGNNESSAKRGIAKLAGGLPVLFLALAAWAVALAGVAVLRHEGGENVLGVELSFTWWVIFFSLFVLLAAAIHLLGAGVGVLPIGSAAISGILAVVTALTMLQTQTWNQQRKATDKGDRIGKGARTAFAGFLALSALNVLLILILGNAQDSHRNQQTTAQYDGAHQHHAATPAGTGQTGLAYAQTSDPVRPGAAAV